MIKAIYFDLFFTLIIPAYEKTNNEFSAIQKEQLLYAREERMKKALKMVSKEILDILERLKSMNIKLGLISNADCIDCKYWEQSPLFQYFDDAIFSCDVALLKPDRQIYELAMQRLNVLPDQCLFVGDGGSSELYGAKSAGMGTVFSEMLEVKNIEERKTISQYADYHVRHIDELFYYL